MSLHALRHALAVRGGALAQALASERATVRDGGGDGATDGGDVPADGGRQPGQDAPALVARGPRAAEDPAEYELLLEMIVEGSLLHYGAPRIVIPTDRDLALLLGDQLYALGLSRLAELGDLDSVAELADLISLLSQAQLARDTRLARAVWEGGAVAIGWGQTPEHEAAKALARAGDAAAPGALLQSAGRVLADTSTPAADRRPKERSR